MHTEFVCDALEQALNEYLKSVERPSVATTG